MRTGGVPLAGLPSRARRPRPRLLGGASTMIGVPYDHECAGTATADSGGANHGGQATRCRRRRGVDPGARRPPLAADPLVDADPLASGAVGVRRHGSSMVRCGDRLTPAGRPGSTISSRGLHARLLWPPARSGPPILCSMWVAEGPKAARRGSTGACSCSWRRAVRSAQGDEVASREGVAGVRRDIDRGSSAGEIPVTAVRRLRATSGSGHEADIPSPLLAHRRRNTWRPAVV
jgi:hypothetical protein